MADKSLQHEWAKLTPRKRLSALLDHPQASTVVRTLPAEDLYFAIAEMGLADCPEIVQLASPQQFRTFVDLGGWKRDHIDAHAVLTWLRAARGDEPEDFMAKLSALDFELVEVMLRELTTVHSLEEDPDANPEGLAVETPEGKYLVEIKVEGPELSALRSIINDLIAANPFEATRLFEALRWELPSEIEEHALRFRQARLADLGFPEFDRALSLYSYLDPAKVTASPPKPIATEALATSGHLDFLKSGSDALEDDERATLEKELRYLVNMALVAETADPGDLDAIRRVTEQCRDTLSLGLEHLCFGEPAQAVSVLREHALKRIFQVGFSLGLGLKFRADRLAKRPVFNVEGTPLLLAEEAAAIAALRRKRPLRALKVEGAEPVPFRSRRELAHSELILSRAENQQLIFCELLGGPSKVTQTLGAFSVPFAQLGVERLWASLVAWAALEGKVMAAPIEKARLVDLGEALFEAESPAQVKAGARERIVRTLSAGLVPSVHPELNRMVDICLARLMAELGQAHLQKTLLESSAPSVILPIVGHVGQ